MFTIKGLLRSSGEQTGGTRLLSFVKSSFSPARLVSGLLTRPEQRGRGSAGRSHTVISGAFRGVECLPGSPLSTGVVLSELGHV